MLVANDGLNVESEIYSSWPLGDAQNIHADHCGELKSTAGAEAISLDNFVRTNAIPKLDFIKLDVDGHEPEVLAGAWDSIRRFKPTILLEWTPHLFAERPDAMRNAMQRLLEMRYSLFDGKSGNPIDGGQAELDKRTSSKGSINVLLRVSGNAGAV